MAKDDATIVFKTGYYAWKTPVEVRALILHELCTQRRLRLN